MSESNEVLAGDESNDLGKSEQTPSKPDNSAIEERASSVGHQGYDDFIEKGGNPADYQSPELFLALQEPIRRIKEQSKQIRRQQKDFDERLAGLNSFHQVQMESQKTQLMAQRDAAMDDFDKDKAHAYQQQIDNLQVQPVPTQANNQGISQELQSWNDDPANDWFKQPGPKQVYASTQFESYRQQGIDDATCIRLMESDITKHFKDINPNIKGAPMAEKGSKPGNKAPIRGLTLNDLTPEEASIYRHRPAGMWKDQEHFLKSVADARSADNG